MSLYLPRDHVVGRYADLDCAADYLELRAFFTPHGQGTKTSSLAEAASLAAPDFRNSLDGDFDDGDDENWVDEDEEDTDDGDEDIVSGAVCQIESRMDTLKSSYPFALEADGDLLTCRLDEKSMDHGAYILCLVLSNLESRSPILRDPDLHPNPAEVIELRKFFQYVATAALAAEIQGAAWSFGHPRPDGSPFLTKLQEIWECVGDGDIQRQRGSPTHPKDDGIDIFAARTHRDRLPGFPLAAAQVATGKNADKKSLKGYLPAFGRRWFSYGPVTDFIVYWIVPFAIPTDKFDDYVSAMGNVLHRLRVPRRVAEARHLVANDILVEAYDKLPEVMRWILAYRGRAGTRGLTKEGPVATVLP